MKERKNIDRLYQEKFKDFEASPREEVWQNISARLKKKEEKKPLIIPLWYKLGGIAAALAVIMGLTYFLNNNIILNTGTEVVFEIEDTNRPKIKFPENNSTLQKAIKLLDSVQAESENIRNTENVQYAANLENSSREKASASELSNIDSNNTAQETNNEEESIASESSPNPTSEDNKFSNPQSQESNSSAIAENEEQENKATEEPASEKNIPDNLDENAGNNALAELADKKEEEKELIPKNEKGKIRLSTFAAPIFYDNLGSGNAISAEFSNNNSQSQVTMAYGLNIAYPINEKLSIRTGISKVNINYDIEEISYAPSAFARNIESIDYNTSNNLQIQDDSPAIRIPNSAESPSGFNNYSAVSPAYVSGQINQQYGFLEVPVEIEYALINKKFDLNIIGGGSSLFLDQNTVSIMANNQRTELGEANNINKVSFSTNIGLGLGYEFLPDFKINVEPIFKYQLNTFKGTEGVQPFFFGIYSGFSFKF
ncbi:hypothetical protein [Autumnicola musiva]|uniref:Outer membrane protein beta-barrel domain-containing protein n=1 Tax=Autumnicola musiva TaxID=3075589 RepID=A0ABU3D1A2_9FLAO|nr:hypothetical protein [Zunongwangia sp. F117]MDT0675322.1 hypothetical protein [Zunongwangia sp. F117]